MNAREAADIIRAIADSIRVNSAQFQININMTGQQVASHGGTGLSITAVGGGPGSTTIGQEVGLGGASVDVSQARATEAMNQRYEALVTSLDTMALELEAATPNKSTIGGIYRSLAGTWVPGVITSVIGNVLSKALGL